MLDSLVWDPCPADEARAIMAGLLGAPDPGLLKGFDVNARLAPLPFYKSWKVAWVESTFHQGGGSTRVEDLFGLYREGHEQLRLDGDSSPIHRVNEDEGLRLTADQAPDYIRFFLYFLRADNLPFVLYERVPDSAKDDKKALAIARPLLPKSTDSDGTMLYDATVIYAGTAFNSVLKLAPNGQIEMLDDEPVEAEMDPTSIPRMPELSVTPLLRACLLQVIPSLAASGPKTGLRGTRRATTPSRLWQLVIHDCPGGRADGGAAPGTGPCSSSRKTG